MYYYVEPEVSGELGEKTIADTSIHPPNISKLHYQFDGWLGDDILEAFPCYIITKQLKEIIQSSDLCGYEITDIEISKSANFLELYPSVILPKFYWLKIVGKAGQSDFGIARDYRLVISDKAMAIFDKTNIKNSDIEIYG